MIIILLLAVTFSSLRAGAMPIKAGPATIPTVAHIILGMSARNGCSDIRSMYDILRSCFFTIAACVYRAIHPNIPNPDLSFWGRMRVMIKVTFYALLVPELIILWAIRQRYGANIIAKEVNEILEKKITNLKREMKWTQTHGQFAQMGGFGRRDNKNVLYPDILIQLLKDDKIDLDQLQLTEKEINDKSKGDFLSKSLVAFQTTWFMFECIVRLRQGLPLIELEVVTLAFATLNAITYGLWWHKPLNVMCPIYLRIFESPSSEVVDTDAGNSEEVPLVGEGQLKEGESVADRDEAKDGKYGARGALGRVCGAIKGLLDVFKEEVTELGWWVVLYWPVMALWALFFLGWRSLLAVVWPLWELLVTDQGGETSEQSPRGVPTFYVIDLPTKQFFGTVLASTVIGMIFGSIHFISWSSPFPSPTQLLLWRVSCVILVVEPLLILFVYVFAFIDEYTSSAIGSFFGAIFVGLSFAGGTLPYIFARICVLVLAFLTLRDLPVDAFTNVSWTSYIPHL